MFLSLCASGMSESDVEERSEKYNIEIISSEIEVPAEKVTNDLKGRFKQAVFCNSNDLLLPIK